ncbi:M28 family metallopeptidase [Hymenobacter yonginensis]|uniref:M20/M25/M40 family metallo-hydrolase n=1 Tax=Hymenobacter yonginensis TaxID=748197 RepID=A0ABY7PK85_9BACT|nr:M28 family peptidase [Hymenobacter yonginensis]WBO83675.1 M20/M25/M40 family metallo-hydrolase [Hymenobacter yonginensis]
MTYSPKNRRNMALAGLVLALSSGTAVAQDMPRVRRTIETLTAPAMHGRGYVSQGEQKAADYLRRRFRELGLQPLAPDYTQPFTLDINTFPGALKLELSLGMLRFPVLGHSRPLRAGTEFIAAPNSGSGHVGGPFSTVPIVRLDTLVFTDTAAQQQLLRRRWYSGGYVLRAADERRLPQLPQPLRQHLDSAALRLTLVPKLTASLADEQAPQMRLQVLDSVWRQAEYRGPGSLAATVEARVDAELKPQYPTQNIVGFVPGRLQPDSFLVVTAHYDHLGRMGARTYFPGANDNASGTAMLLELAAHYSRPENRPAYSVVFLAFGAEEAGLLGSRYFVEHPLVPLARIRFLLNLDLVGTGSEGATVVNGRTLPTPFARLQVLNARRQALPALAARGPAANSDHFPFSERGVPAFFLYTRGGPTAYHDVQDQAATLPLTAFPNLFGLLREFLDELGGRSAQ